MKTTRVREWFSPFYLYFLFSSRRLRPLAVCIYGFGSQTTILHSPAPVKAALAGAVSFTDVSKRRFRAEYSPPRYNAALTDNPRVVLCPTAPAIAVRCAQVRAESPFSPRRRIYIRREGESGDRKTNYKQKEKPVRGRERVSTLNAFHNAKSFHRAKCFNGSSNNPFVFRSVRASARRPQAQEIDPGLGSLMIDSFRNSTAWRRPSSGVIRLSSCSMLITLS